MKKIFYFCTVLTLLVFVLGCGGSKKDNVYDYPDEDSTDADTADDSEEPASKQGELDGECYPNKTCNEGLVCDKDSNTCIKDPGNTEEPDDDTDTASEKDDSDSDISDTGITDNDVDTDSGDSTPDEDSDTDSGDTQTDNDPDTDTGNPEATENHKISGSYQIGSDVSGIEVFLHECGKTEKIAYANTDADGKYSFNADISADKVYCVNANSFYSCFAGMSDHTANISEITHVVALISTCPDFRKNETKVRKYVKLGTGKWLGELDYTKLSGIKEGLRLLSSYLDTTDSKTLSEEIADDILRTDRKFQKFFNGFKISANRNEVLINVANPDSNEVTLNVEGGSSVVAEGFKIVWTALNTTAEAATHKFRSVEPGEYVVRARLGGDPIMGGNGDDGGDPIMITEDSATILFLLEKATDVIDVRDMSKDIVKYIDNGIYAVIPKNTTIKKGNSPVNYLTYKLTKSNSGSQVSKIDFGPDGTTFTGDSLYFIYELGTVFGGDPIMLSSKRINSNGSVDVLQSAGGDPIMMEDGGNPMMFTAAGDPIMHIARSSGGNQIMYNAGGDPIMISDGSDSVGAAAGGDPIMVPVTGETSRIAAGDPIMMGTSSSVMIAKTGHFSEFLINSNSLPVSVEALVARWCDGSFYRGYSPIKFIKEGVEAYKPAGAEKTNLLYYLDSEHFGELGSDLYELMNKQVGYQRNLNLFENIFFISEFYNRMKARRESGEVAAVTNGIELRSAIAALYTSTTSYNRSATLADMFDSSMIPLTYTGVIPSDYSAAALAAISGSLESGNKFVASKKDMMIFANYVTTSAKGPDFSGVSSPLTADKFICAWFNPETPAQNCGKVYTLNDAGHVTADGREVSLEEADAIFTHFFMPFNSRISEEEKLSLFRTFFLTLKYAGIVFQGGTALDALNEKLLETAYLVFDGINRNVNAVSIEDTFDASEHTVQVLKENVMETKPYITKVSALTDKISLNVAAASADVEKVLVRIEGYEFDKITDNTRTYYKPKGELKEKSIILAPGTLSSGLKPLKELLGTNNVDSLGNITGKVTVVATSKISGKTYTAQKTYEFLANSESDGVESKPVPANLQIMLKGSDGNVIPQEANPGIILNPGNRILYPDSIGLINITELAPASYTINAFADGYYTKNVGVNVTAGATFGVDIKLDKLLASSAGAALELTVSIATAKHPSNVYIQIYDENMELVANETAKFNTETNTYDKVNVEITAGRYTLLAVGEEMYNYLESITIYEGNNSKEITVVAKNACGNGIIDSSEDCEPSVSGNLTCSDIYPAAPNPANQVVCNPATCVYDKSECGITFADCGDGIIDAGEGCDGGAKECSEIIGFEGSKGSAPCASDCSDWVTAGNCSKVAADCGTKPANTQWNDGTGKFEQTWNGTKWMPESKASDYGTTREECVYSCAKGYKWYNGACIDDPLSLGNICTGETGCFDNVSEMTECPVYGSTLFGQDAQYAEAGYCTQHSFSTTGSGSQQIVLDGFTHYEWHRVSSNSAMTWDEAEEYCRTSTYGGKQLYWRLPSPAELLTIVDSDTTSPALSGSFIIYGYSFWSGEDEKTAGNAWMLGENGELESVEKSASNHVICVHVNDYDPLQDRFTLDTETVKDAESGLMWQRYYTSAKTWSEALFYCENSSAGEKYDWRLPNRNELASLVDYNKADGTMSAFPGIAAKEFWTSTSSVSEPAKAWTVDFESGAIAAGVKYETKYLICVRKDEQCLGSDCVNPCDFAPCRNTVNSTGVCKPSEGGDSYSCLCYSGFEWNKSLAKCVLPEFMPHGCEGLPEEHAQWNNVTTINQYHDGQGNWYPSYIAEYNEVPSSSECRFKCDANFVYERDTNKCVGAKKPAYCTGDLPDNTEWWNPDGMFIQEWKLNETTSIWQWLPETNYKVFGYEADENECRYKCKENYTWDGNSICVADTRTRPCEDLISNASWWNGSITQTWNGNDWVPSLKGIYSRKAVENECRFKCSNGYFWDGEGCVSPCYASTNPCSGVANSNGSCNATGPADYTCGCAEGYYWWDNQGCIERKPVALGNICTITEGCYDTESQMACPEEGEDFYGQPSQYAAKGICAARSFSDNNSVENEPTLLDNNTGLEWQKNLLSAFGSLETALEYCENLEYGGHSDWRLPTQYEMMTVFDHSQRDIVIKPAYTEYFYWTSTVISDEDGALVWSSGYHKWFPSNYTFYEGYADCGENCGYSIPSDKFAFCVRGKELPAADFVVSEKEGDEIVTDRTTGLMWQKTSTVTTWKNALSYCENLDYAGFSDWRLPNTNEWASNDDVYNPAPVFEWITGESAGYWFSADTPTWESQTYYWSVSMPAWNASAPLVPVFITSYKTNSGYEFKANVRCVRSGLCGEGEFWNGSECVTPCHASSCGGGAEAECVPISYDSYKCECHNAGAGFFWNGSTSTCVNPCDTASCADVPHSTHECIPTDWNTHACGCESGYFWDNTQCVPLTLGRICTGKTRCSDNSGEIVCPAEGEDFFGQDWQYARFGFCAPRSFRTETISGDEIIIDDKLGLEWQSLHYPTSPTDIDRIDWYYAVDYCNNLVYAGHDDWRLPSVKEFFSLKYNPIDWKLGDGQGLWTSQERGEDYAIVVFDNYYDSYYQLSMPGKDDFYAVRCVRGNTIPDANLYSSTVTSGGSSYRIVTDSTTRLIWQKNPEGSTKTWKKALADCENLEYAGLSNWRLPNNNELMSLINNNGSSNFHEISGDPRKFWTSSSLYEASGSAFTLDSSGNGNFDSKTGKYYAVCVHSDICKEGEFWNGSACVNPCEPNPCATLANSTHECTATAWNNYECGCDDNFYWWGKEQGCRSQRNNLGVICTGLKKCFSSFGEIECPVEESYLSFFGQDAQYAELGSCIPQNFSLENIAGDDVVIDHNTGLEWQAKISERYDTWTEALLGCANLNYAGKRDWYLPTRTELLTIFDASGSSSYFTETNVVWSSSKMKNLAEAWAVSFSDGQPYRAGSENLFNYRCVRGNLLADAELNTATMLNSDEIVFDSTNHLFWQGGPYYWPVTWQEALSLCENLEYAGLSNWRLPNRNELLTLLNNKKRQTPSTFPPANPDLISKFFWSSSPSGDSNLSVLAVDFYEQNVSYVAVADASNDKNSVICVHSDICEDGKFWSGSACVNPCDADPCGGAEHSVCVPKSHDTYICECDNADDGYFWSGSACVNPCNANPCAAVEHWNGDCIPTDWNKQQCGCADGYAWYGSSCHDISTPADPNYNDTYGTLELNFNESINTSGSDVQDVLYNAFAIGPYGNGEAYVSNSNVASVAFYYDESGSTGVSVVQLPYYNGSSGLWVQIIIPEEFATLGEHTVSVLNEDSSLSPLRIFLYDYDESSSSSCYHAFGEGTINISEIGNIANHGILAFTGRVTLYSPKNYHGLDISYMITDPVCDPVL